MGGVLASAWAPPVDGLSAPPFFDLPFFAVFGVEERECAESELEVDGIFVRRLPLEDVGVGAEFVGGAFACEDQAVVAVRQALEDRVEGVADVV